MLPLDRLLAAIGRYALLLLWTRLLPSAAGRSGACNGYCLFLFVVDWLVSAASWRSLITLRLILLAGSFALFFATTTPGRTAPGPGVAARSLPLRV